MANKHTKIYVTKLEYDVICKVAVTGHMQNYRKICKDIAVKHGLSVMPEYFINVLGEIMEKQNNT